MAKAQHNSIPFSVLYLLLFALMPLIYVSTIVDNTLIPRQLFSSVILLIIGGIIWQSRSRENISLGPVLLFMLGFLVINIISVGAAINPVESWAIITRYLVAFAYLVFTIHLLRNSKLSPGQLVKGIVLFAAVTAIITLVNLLQALGSGDFVSDIYSVSGTFGHKNLLSSALMLSFPFAVLGSIILEKGAWRRASLILSLLLIAEMFVLRTRGVWLSMFMGTAVSMISFFAVRNRGEYKVNFPFRWIGIGAGLALVILMGLFMTKGFRDNIGDRTNLERRFVFWQNSFEMIKEHPITGVGAGNWRINFPKYGLSPEAKGDEVSFRLDQSVYQGITHIQRPHNDYLWVWAESGPLGLLCFLAVFVSALVRLYKNLKDFSSKEDLAIDLLSLFGIVAYLSFSMTDFPLERTSHSLLMLSLVALPFRKGNFKPAWSIKSQSVSAVLMAGMIFSIVLCIYRWQGEKHTKVVHDANSRRDARTIIPAVDDAINSFYNMDHYANPLRYYSSIGKLAMKNVNGAFNDAQDAYAIHPYNIIVLNQMGNVHKAKNNLDEALKYYQQAVDISRWFESGRLNLAEVYVKKNQPVEAMEALSLVRRSSRNRKFLNLLSQVLPQVVKTYPEHQRFGPLVEYLRERNPQSREEYVQYFLEFRLPESEG